MKNDSDKIKKDSKDEEKTGGHEEHGHECRCGQEKEHLKKRVEELDNSYKRALADYQNLQKRVLEERSDWLRIANRELLLRLLPVLDTLILAQIHIQDDGLKVTIGQFLDTLKAEGVVKIETKDKDFDPQLMECIASIEGEEGKVIDEVRSGYMLYDKVLRPAQVRVGAKS